jgi:hypothetical protein
MIWLCIHTGRRSTLLVRRGVGTGTAADQIGASITRRNEQLLGAEVVDRAFLRKYANLAQYEIDRQRYYATSGSLAPNSKACSMMACRNAR